ncbi:Gfo/Idh/MocA family oxidoreductase [Streptomyces sp. NPDC079167]|uniref:Gfo/Idh/MocA family protein n=1 Tax=Streptomyces sp. NPDC079167 TaxID=3154513 RepID=UPI003426A819
MRVGIMGAGGIGRTHAQAVLAVEGATLAGFYDVDGPRAAVVADGLGVPAFTSPDAFYEAVDAVVVASPNRTHASYACEAVDRGCHVLCEKPMAVSVEETLAMRERAAGAPVVCCVGFNYRCLGVVREIRRQIDEGVLGRVLHVDLAFRRGSALTRKTFTWRDNAAERFTSGALGDLGVHLIDLLHHLFGSEVDTGSCEAGLRTKVAAKEGRKVCVDDHAFVSGRLTGGPHFTLTASKSSLPEDVGFRVSATGTRGELRYNSQDGPVLDVRTGVEWEPVKILGTPGLEDPPGEIHGWADSFVTQLHHWTAAVAGLGRAQALAGFDDGHRAQRVLDELLRKGKAG